MSPFTKKLDARLVSALQILRARLDEGKPRRLSVRSLETTVVLTDACFAANSSGGLGGVLVDQTCALKLWYRLKLSSQLVRRFMKEDQEVARAELEALAVLLAMQLWMDDIKSRHVVFCLDNEVARFGFIKGYSQADLVSRICNIGNELCALFMRVPSAANLADFPSRFMDHPFLEADRTVLHELAENALRAATTTLLASVPSNGVGTGA